MRTALNGLSNISVMPLVPTAKMMGGSSAARLNEMVARKIAIAMTSAVSLVGIASMTIVTVWLCRSLLMRATWCPASARNGTLRFVLRVISTLQYISSLAVLLDCRLLLLACTR